MSMIRYEPWSMLQDVNNIFENMLQRRIGDNSRRAEDNTNIETSQWVPAVDIKEEADCFIFTVDLPGVDKDKIDIAMENNVLTIRGNKEEEYTDNKDNYRRIERVTGSFYRRFALPESVDNEKIRAKSRNGVLEITIPKKEKAQPRRIDIVAEE